MDKKLDDQIKKLADEALGEDYYDLMVRTGIAAGMDPEVIAKELGTTVANVLHLRKKYKEEIKELRVHYLIATKVWEDLAKVKMLNMHMALLEDVMAQVETKEIYGKEAIDLLKFLTKHLTQTGSGMSEQQKNDAAGLSDEEFEKRKKALLAVVK